MTIRRKLLLIIALILAFLAALDITYYLTLETIQKRLTLVESVDDLGVSISEMRRGEKNYLLYHDQTSARDWLAQIDQTRRAIHEKAAELSEMEGMDYYQRLVKDFSRYEKLVRPLISQANSGVDSDFVRKQGHKVYTYARGIIHAERERIDTTTRLAYRIFLVSLFVATISGLAGVVIIMRDIIRPLAKIELATHQVSEGKYVPIKGIRSHDEISKLQKAFNHMVQQIENHQEDAYSSRKARLARNPDLGGGPRAQQPDQQHFDDRANLRAVLRLDQRS